MNRFAILKDLPPPKHEFKPPADSIKNDIIESIKTQEISRLIDIPSLLDRPATRVPTDYEPIQGTSLGQYPSLTRGQLREMGRYAYAATNPTEPTLEIITPSGARFIVPRSQIHVHYHDRARHSELHLVLPDRIVSSVIEEMELNETAEGRRQRELSERESFEPPRRPRSNYTFNI
jgi:hypothetical protein